MRFLLTTIIIAYIIKGAALDAAHEVCDKIVTLIKGKK